MVERLSLKTCRLIAGYSVREVALQTGLSEKTIRNWEQSVDKLKCAKLDSIMQLCKLYGVSIDNIIT